MPPENDSSKTTAENQILRRKTFAIISHPDAGKTTLTEKLLLYSGVLREAGTVKVKAGKRHVTSDWMELERKRGISITTTAVQFDYKGYCINLLDTPGHKDFSEDTYRTLMAVDSAVMLIDAAKGVEAQTRKLFQVCRQAGIPIFTFINKMDRETKPPLELLSEIEEVLGIQCSAINWPIGSGQFFSGNYSFSENKFHVFDRDDPDQKSHKTKSHVFNNIQDIRDLEQFQSSFYKNALDAFMSESELISAAGNVLDEKLVLSGQQSPVFFGSAMNNFGIELFLDYFIKVAPAPVPRTMTNGETYPVTNNFSGVVFKVQANMDPQHRDSLAFFRICSGSLDLGVKLKNSRTQKDYRINTAFSIVGRERTPIQEAYAGDVIGLVDTGSYLRIGDTLSQDDKVSYRVWTRFLPEVFADIQLLEQDKRKQLAKGIEQLSGEGMIQCLYDVHHTQVLPTLGVIGELQFDVVLHRLENEYGVKVRLTRLPFITSRLVLSQSKVVASSLENEWKPLKDIDGNILVLFQSEWSVKFFHNYNKDVVLATDYSEVPLKTQPK